MRSKLHCKKTFSILLQQSLTPQIIYRWKANEKRYICILIVLQKSEKRKRKMKKKKMNFWTEDFRFKKVASFDSLHHDRLKNVYVPWQKSNNLGDIRVFRQIFFSFVFHFFIKHFSSRCRTLYWLSNDGLRVGVNVERKEKSTKRWKRVYLWMHFNP